MGSLWSYFIISNKSSMYLLHIVGVISYGPMVMAVSSWSSINTFHTTTYTALPIKAPWVCCYISPLQEKSVVDSTTSSSSLMSSAMRFMHRWRALSALTLFPMIINACLMGTLVNRLNTSWEFMISPCQSRGIFVALMTSPVQTRNILAGKIFLPTIQSISTMK